MRHFDRMGAQFVIPAEDLALKIKNMQALIFDWDGVFNDGTKGVEHSSTFNEADSMGTNMLRFGFWLKNGRMPAAAVISGQKNRSAKLFAMREHFNGIFMGIRDKRLAVEHLCTEYQIPSESIACVFDDINDLAMAQICGVRCLVRRQASPLFKAYARDHRLCDYITGHPSGSYAVREISELFLGLSGLFEKVVQSRIALDHDYRQYFNQRQTIATRFYKQEGDTVVVEPDR